MQSIATLVNDDPYLKMPREERIALRRQRREKLRLSDFQPIELRPITFSIPNTPFGVPKIAPRKPVKRPEPVLQYRMWFEDLVRDSEALVVPPPPPLVEDIQRAVAFHFGVSRLELIGAARAKYLVWPRHVAMYLCKTMTIRSLPDIARRFGNRDHSTAIYAVNKIATLALKDEELACDIAAIKQALQVSA